MVDVLGLQDSKQNVAAVEKLAGALSTLSDVYVVSTFRLPAKLGGVLLGVYSKQDNRKYLELAVMGKINKGCSNAVPAVMSVCRGRSDELLSKLLCCRTSVLLPSVSVHSSSPPPGYPLPFFFSSSFPFLPCCALLPFLFSC